MKKVFFIAAVVAAAAFGVMKANDVNVTYNMSDLQLENVELLAEGEDDGKRYFIIDRYSNGTVVCYHPGDKICR